MRQFNCLECGKEARTYNPKSRFCSRACSDKALSGPGSPNWQDVPRTKTCAACGKEYGPRPKGFTSFVRGRFCSRECGWKGQRYLRGEEKPNWSPTARRRNRGHVHASWSQQVISRDKATCQHCGVTGVEMHAHHIKPFRDHQELRGDVSNGITLCHLCHWTVHSKSAANGVNSGDTAPGDAGGNPEPSPDRKVREGVTVRRRAYRRIETNCANCGTFVSKRLSSVVSDKLYCSKSCKARHMNPQDPDKHLDVACGNCGAIVRKSRAQTKVYPVSFCDRRCSARYHNRSRRKASMALIPPKSAPAAS